MDTAPSIFDEVVNSWINAQESYQEAVWLARYALAFNRLDIEPLRNWLAPDVTYDSQSVLETMHGPETFLKYLEGKFKAIRAHNSQVVAELATFPDGKLCVAMCQVGEDHNKEWLESPIAAMTVTMADDGAAQAMLMITCVPVPASAKGTGVFPGFDVEPGRILPFGEGKRS